MVEEEICKELVCLGGIFLAGVGLGQILVLSGKCALTGPGTVALGFFLLFIYLFFQRLAAVVTSVEEKVNLLCSCSYEEGSLSGGHASAADSSDHSSVEEKVNFSFHVHMKKFYSQAPAADSSG